MAVFKYQATLNRAEENLESGTIVAKSEAEAKQKLKQLKYDRISVKKIGGLSGLFKQWTADIR